MGWLITGSILLLLAVLPLGVSIRYNRRGLCVKAVLGGIKLTVYPMHQKEKKEKEKTASDADAKIEQEDPSLPKPPQPPKQDAAKSEKKEKGGSLLDFLPFVKLALELLGDFRRKLRVDNLYLRLILAGGDPSDLAVNYGRAWAATGNLIPQLERFLVIKKRDIEVECDFEAAQTTVVTRIDLTITLGRLLALAVCYGFRALKEYLFIQKKRKGGAVK